MDGNGHCSSGQSYCRCVGKGLSFALSHQSGMTVSVFPLPITQSLGLSVPALSSSLGIGRVDTVGRSCEGVIVLK